WKYGLSFGRYGGLIAVVLLGYLTLSGFDCGGPPPTQICFVVEDQCAGLAGASIRIEEWVKQNDGGFTQDRVSTGAATQMPRRYIEGDEVNFGFWSKNGHRKHTYAEMFQIKYGRVPTPTEEAAITDEQVRQWFDEKYTTSNIFTTEHPQNVRTFTDSPALACYEYTRGAEGNIYSFVELRGTITFPNGMQCKLDLKDWDKDAGPSTNPNVRKAVVRRPCSACN
ncbi:MAG TPA: hypothetical protein VHI13_11525, partial [Candidatus Kapabacteria bacterium]|nr:hypothetical protein [Candidatus Kapabacteria bacterium]